MIVRKRSRAGASRSDRPAPQIRQEQARESRPKELTFSWVYPLVLTHLCGYQCAYCSFPSMQAQPLPSLAKIKDEVKKARQLGLIQMRIIAGEGIENHAKIVSAIRYYGLQSFAHYLQSVMGEVTRNSVAPPVFPELDIGNLSLAQMQKLRFHIFTLRLFLESMDPDLQYGLTHGHSRGKWPRHRLNTLLTAGRLGIPVNSGIMVGIGERPETRIQTLEMLAEGSRRYHHIQSVLIQPFVPEPNTLMAGSRPPSVEELLEVVKKAAEILPANVQIQFPIVRYPTHAMEFVEAGAGDLGDFEICGDQEKDAAVIDAYKQVREQLGESGLKLRDRLSLFPKFSNQKWVTPHYAKLLKDLASHDEVAK